MATNENDILARALSSVAAMSLGGVKATQSPSMDIQVSSNLCRRLLFGGRRAKIPEAIRTLMSDLGREGRFVIPQPVLQRIRGDFLAIRIDEADCTKEMSRAYRESGVILDPHSAIGVRAARSAFATSPAAPVIALGTAHPAKFPDAVERRHEVYALNCPHTSRISWTARRRPSFCRTIGTRSPTTSGRLRERRREH